VTSGVRIEPTERFFATSTIRSRLEGMKRISMVTFPLLAMVSASCMSSAEIRRREYDAQYQQALRLCGRPDAAFQTGYNAGYGGQRMNGEWVGLCVPASQGEASAAYQRGFLEGANNAPVRVVHSIQAPRYPQGQRSGGVATTQQSECTFDSDCGGEGYSCRDHSCMGYGLTGDRCVFNSDCSNDHCFGGTCRE
jgi:hypothetical protein